MIVATAEYLISLGCLEYKACVTSDTGKATGTDEMQMWTLDFLGRNNRQIYLLWLFTRRKESIVYVVNGYQKAIGLVDLIFSYKLSIGFSLYVHRILEESEFDWKT